jgi:mono/diheme cytochrome c family protein
VLHIILYGIRPPSGQAGPIMPAFSGALTDAQIADLVKFMRSTFSDQPAWANIDDEIKQIRTAGDSQAPVMAKR